MFGQAVIPTRFTVRMDAQTPNIEGEKETMRVIEPGHIYELSSLDGELEQHLTFVAREPENNRVHPGTQTQDVLRCLIDRTKHCDECIRWEGNDEIIYHLRMALVLHEARALERKTLKGYIQPEHVAIGEDGHFTLTRPEDIPTSLPEGYETHGSGGLIRAGASQATEKNSKSTQTCS